MKNNDIIESIEIAVEGLSLGYVAAGALSLFGAYKMSKITSKNIISDIKESKRKIDELIINENFEEVIEKVQKQCLKSSYSIKKGLVIAPTKFSNYKQSYYGGIPAGSKTFDVEDFLDDHEFITQINLSELKYNPYLPKKGFLQLYKGLDYENPEFNVAIYIKPEDIVPPSKAISTKCITNFGEGLNCGESEAFTTKIMHYYDNSSITEKEAIDHIQGILNQNNCKDTYNLSDMEVNMLSYKLFYLVYGENTNLFGNPLSIWDETNKNTTVILQFYSDLGDKMIDGYGMLRYSVNTNKVSLLKKLDSGIVPFIKMEYENE